MIDADDNGAHKYIADLKEMDQADEIDEYIEIDKVTDFYRKVSGAAEIEVKLKEVVYENGNYRYK